MEKEFLLSGSQHNGSSGIAQVYLEPVVCVHLSHRRVSAAAMDELEWLSDYVVGPPKYAQEFGQHALLMILRWPQASDASDRPTTFQAKWRCCMCFDVFPYMF